jgi:hypothetical protein
MRGDQDDRDRPGQDRPQRAATVQPTARVDAEAGEVALEEWGVGHLVGALLA